LLFEECRAQLYSSYEESLEAVGRDAHVAVRVKTVDRRERGMLFFFLNFYRTYLNLQLVQSANHLIVLWLMHPGWYDVVVLPMHDYKWNFKEGDVAILSFPRPGSGRSLNCSFTHLFSQKISRIRVFIPLLFVAAQSGRSSRRAVGSNEDAESECGRLVGTVRRHMPIDTRDPIGAIIHFYLGDSFDSNRY